MAKIGLGGDKLNYSFRASRLGIAKIADNKPPFQPTESNGKAWPRLSKEERGSRERRLINGSWKCSSSSLVGPRGLSRYVDGEVLGRCLCWLRCLRARAQVPTEMRILLTTYDQSTSIKILNYVGSYELG